MVQYLGKSNTYAALVHSDCLMPRVVIVYNCFVCLCLDSVVFFCVPMIVHCHYHAVYIYRVAMQTQQRQWPGIARPGAPVQMDHCMESLRLVGWGVEGGKVWHRSGWRDGGTLRGGGTSLSHRIIIRCSCA